MARALGSGARRTGLGHGLLLGALVALAGCASKPPGPGPHFKIGVPYEVDGRWYYPKFVSAYDATGVASWYGASYDGRATANGEIYDVGALTARTFAPELARLLESGRTLDPFLDEAFTEDAIRVDQLRMMFSCCHPRLPADAQVALVLNVLCGFGADEIAGAFLSSRAAVEKRLSRGKRALAGARRLFDLSADDFRSRLSAVRRAL